MWLQVRMRSALIAAVAALFISLLAGCMPQEGGPGHPNPIIIREFAVSPGVITLDPSFGFSLYRGSPGVPARQRAAGLGRAVAFNLADAMAQQLSSLGYDVIRSDTAAVEPGARAMIVSGTFRHINEGYRRRVGAENSSVGVDVQIDYQPAGAPPQLLTGFPLDSRLVGDGGLTGVSARTTADVKIAASRLGAAIARYVADTARLSKWPAAAR
jgi:Domain of unknown function (DUF4410)